MDTYVTFFVFSLSLAIRPFAFDSTCNKTTKPLLDVPLHSYLSDAKKMLQDTTSFT